MNFVGRRERHRSHHVATPAGVAPSMGFSSRTAGPVKTIARQHSELLPPKRRRHLRDTFIVYTWYQMHQTYAARVGVHARSRDGPVRR